MRTLYHYSDGTVTAPGDDGGRHHMDTLDLMAASARKTIVSTADILAYRVEATEPDFELLDSCVAIIERELKELYAYHYFRKHYEELCASADALTRVEQYAEAAS